MLQHLIGRHLVEAARVTNRNAKACMIMPEIQGRSRKGRRIKMQCTNSHHGLIDPQVSSGTAFIANQAADYYYRRFWHGRSGAVNAPPKEGVLQILFAKLHLLVDSTLAVLHPGHRDFFIFWLNLQLEPRTGMLPDCTGGKTGRLDRENVFYF